MTKIITVVRGVCGGRIGSDKGKLTTDKVHAIKEPGYTYCGIDSWGSSSLGFDTDGLFSEVNCKRCLKAMNK